jgi:uncharacterized protein (TIGR02271 family)
LVTNETGYDNTNYQPGDVWEIDHGYDVFAADGEKVGDVQEVHPHYLVVSKGFFFPTERYVPVSAITDVREDRVFVNVTKDQIDSQGWDTVPNADDVDTYTTSGMTPTTGSTTAYADATATDDTLLGERTTETVEDNVRIPVMEEQLSVNKHEVRRGLVRVHKTVEEEQASVNVPLREETVHVERRAATGDYNDTLPTDAFQETEIDIPLRGEEADVTKRAVVREEVVIDKDVVERDQQVTDTIRREDVHVHDADDDTNTNTRLQG